MAVKDDPVSPQGGPERVGASTEPPRIPVDRKDRSEKQRDGGKALIDALTIQQRRNARPRGERSGRATPAEVPEPPAPPQTTPRLPRGSNASAQLERARAGRSPAQGGTEPRERRGRAGRGAQADRIYSESRYDPEFDRSKGGAPEGEKARGEKVAGRGTGKLFNPEFGAAQPSQRVEGRRGSKQRGGGPRHGARSPSEDESRWTLEDEDFSKDVEDPYPFPPRPEFYGHPPPPPPFHHHGYGPPPPHHFGPGGPHHGRFGPPFHSYYGGPPHHSPGPQGSPPDFHTFHHGPPPGLPSGPPPPGRRLESSPFPPAPGNRLLYDHRRDDPVRFQAVKRPNTNGDGKSTASSNNQSGTTRSQRRRARAAAGDAASSSGGSKGTPQPGEDKHGEAVEGDSRQSDGSNTYVKKLKKAFKAITELERTLKDEEASYKAREDELKMRDRDGAGTAQMRLVGQKRLAGDYWIKLIKQHQQLADAHRQFLDMSLDPRLPPSLHSLPRKYDIPIRLWQTAFHQLLERLRHALPPLSPSDEADADSQARVEGNVLLDHMTDFIYFAYGFYTALLEEAAFADFRNVWIEQLGDLARYRMAVAGLVTKYSQRKGLFTTLAPDDADDDRSDAGSLGAKGRVSDSDEGEAGRAPKDAPVYEPEELDRGGGSIGVAALNDWDYEEQDTWRNVARDWYAKGLAETPANGRLHHHLALLSKGDEMRALYHYVKSLTAPHPYLPARESILPFFESEHQARRTRSDVSLNDLFVRLHGMIFTKIQLDDFDAELARFIERLVEERYLFCKLGTSAARPVITEASWIMMATVNIGALLQYGIEDGVLNQAMRSSAIGPKKSSRHQSTRPQAILLSSAANKKEVGDSASEVAVEEEELAEDVVKALEGTHLDPGCDDREDPLPFRLAAKLCFSMLDEVLRQPLRPSLSGCVPTMLPYITVVLTFLGQVGQSPKALRKLEPYLPWTRLVNLFNKVPRNEEIRPDVSAFKLVGTAMPEDWCLRGMDWAGKTLFGRGYFKPKSHRKGKGDLSAVAESEMDALTLGEMAEDDRATDGMIQADGDADPDIAITNLAAARWRRIAGFAGWAAGPKATAGIGFDPSGPKFAILGSLRTKMNQWANEAKVEAAAKAASLQRRSIVFEDGSAAVDEADDGDGDDDIDDENDSDLVKTLKARRRELRAIIRDARGPKAAERKAVARTRGAPIAPTAKPGRRALEAFAGYTILVFDTNILVGMLSIVRGLLEAARWTIVVPLAVVTELDGLKQNPPPLGQDASEAIRFLETSIRAQSKYLKVQTSRGNYLHDLSIRSESIDFADSETGAVARNMDDLVLRAAVWQDEHFANRLAIVNPSADRSRITPSTAKVVLVTFDRNLRLKARARGIVAADEKDIATLLSLHDKG